jgi:hypothetical protein
MRKPNALQSLRHHDVNGTELLRIDQRQQATCTRNGKPMNSSILPHDHSYRLALAVGCPIDEARPNAF